ncbi:MAG: hypothetical protein WC994_09135 [Brumimicrobium sp.]
MLKPIRIAIVGDYNYTSAAHQSTNLAIGHAAEKLEIEVDYFWIRLYEAIELKNSDLKNYDGVWFAPNPFNNLFFLDEILDKTLDANIPIFITGMGFRRFIKALVRKFHLNPNNEKTITENLLPDKLTKFEEFEIKTLRKTISAFYGNQPQNELSNVQYSIYPDFLPDLCEIVDIEAINQYEDPTIISLKGRPFCVATMTLPQLTSIKDHPHPLISGFLNFIRNSKAESI